MFSITHAASRTRDGSRRAVKVAGTTGVGDKVTLTPSQAGSFYKTPDGAYVPMPEMGGNVDPVSLFGWLGIGMEEFEKAMTFFGTLIAMPPEMIDGYEGTDFDSFIRAIARSVMSVMKW